MKPKSNAYSKKPCPDIILGRMPELDRCRHEDEGCLYYTKERCWYRTSYAHMDKHPLDYRGDKFKRVEKVK